MSDTHTKSMDKESAPQKSEMVTREEEVLAFWSEHDVFNKSLEKDSPNGDFVFYDGPPFATGLPHIGNLLSSVIKDVVGRYWTMKGYHVERRWGWDCHGLPIENMIEKELGLKTKKEIYTLGIDKFNEACRAAVLRFSDEWKKYVTRIGRWTEYDGAYKTMDNSYMESVWWFIAEMHKKGLLYEGRRVLLYCPHCETPLSKAEIAMDNSYKDVTEESVYVKFKVKDPAQYNLPENTYLLAWTTTPWTLPGNVALAVGEDIEYVVLQGGESSLIIAKSRAEKVGLQGNPEKEIRGKDLVGVAYEPLYTVERALAENKEKAFTVLSADFVTTEEGTGIVHTAVIYGEDDYQLGLKEDLPMVPLLDSAGHFTDDAPELVRGQYFKKSEKAIKEDLELRGLLLKRETHTHSYPHCYRCGTALLYNALVSWFIDIQKIKDQLLATNEDINWFPEHLKHGRYKNILENAPDWTISRNRFWATALPIWKNTKTGDVTTVGSVAELKQHTKKSGNRYFLMRHGESEGNVNGVISAQKENKDALTETGRKEVAAALPTLKEKGIDVVIHSDFLRTKETAEIIAEGLGLSKDAVLGDARVGELQAGTALEGKSWEEYHALFANEAENFTKQLEDAENRMDVNRRVGGLLYEVERTYAGKNILLVGHAASLFALESVAEGASVERACEIKGKGFFKNAEVRELTFIPLPHNANYELDLHRPYIDDVPLVAEDGTPLARIPEVIDVWAESGSMPFAAQNYPHSNQEEFKRSFPADFIAEYIAQTRTWFYYMHTVSVLLFGKSSFKNVVTTGNVLAEDGTKMSKSKLNFTDPLVNLNMYGADALRYYLMSSVVMQAEDMSFKDQELKEVHNRVLNILWNTFKFYDLYKAERVGKVDPTKSANVLDTWILSRLNMLTLEVTKYMDVYDLTRATRPMRDFVDDFSTWYVRRSRDRFKGDDVEDKQYALETTRYVLLTFSRLIAPVIPFIAESVYQGAEGERESVHLEVWPTAGSVNEKVLEDVAKVREIVSRGLEARSRANIKVRQPLQKLSVKADSAALYSPHVESIKSELNVKDVVFDESIEEEVALDITLTGALRDEGNARDLMRAIQDMRKNAGLQPHDRIIISVKTSSEGEAVIRAFQDEIQKTVGADTITFGETKGEEVTAGEHTFVIQLAISQ